MEEVGNIGGDLVKGSRALPLIFSYTVKRSTPVAERPELAKEFFNKLRNRLAEEKNDVHKSPSVGARPSAWNL